MDRSDQPSTCPSCGHPARITDEGQCYECGMVLSRNEPHSRRPRFLSLPPMRYPNPYVWLVLVSALDIFLTILVLYAWKGHEVNPIAAAIIAHMGFQWTVVFKYALIVLVIIICEVVGRRNDRTGWKLAMVGIMLSAFPVAYPFALLFRAGPAPID